ncbi:alpha/beta hydrolase [Cellulophaga baltica]|uniref:S-formylglutathione hydrolase FrmB n=1 Tax=Cellulophaga baltica TaxID=76594 RepID=A0A1G7E5P6_9FLAO|nr:alpha/beta hydrolase family protein [Cellulophaga baltica]SDE58993.1 S-formylglutathione hydrolase FrmB [Cellulophaga baltica]
MFKFLSFLIAFFFSLGLLAAKIDTLVVSSKSMRKKIKNLVITPDSYQKKELRYNVVYLLHGAGGNHKSWLEKAPELEQYADLYNVIVVCPDGDKTSWYFDSPVDDSMKYETYIVDELVSKIDKKYDTVPNAEYRAITGYSMGGHGALYLAFRHSDIWGAAASMSGGVDIRPFPLQWDIAKRLGEYANAPEAWEKHTVINLTNLLNGENLDFLIDCGVDDFFYNANLRLHQKLLERNIPHDYIERPGGHTNEYWRNSIKYQMLFFNDFFQKSKEQTK